MMYQIIAKYYRLGIYTNRDVAAYVVRGTITAAQYREITGKEYSK